jgi:thioredoxin-related protein
MKKITGSLLIIFALAAVFSFSGNDKEKINWISMQQLTELYAKEPRPIMVDIYTDWCGWCKEMDRTTYKNDKLSSYINQKYYAVKFNAESRDIITFNKQVFKYNPKYKTNELALYLTGGNLSYPTTVFMGGIAGQPAPLPGYLKPRQMEGPAKFFGEKANEKGTFVEFNKKLHNEW